jgi:hypothetical protein
MTITTKQNFLSHVDGLWTYTDERGCMHLMTADNIDLTADLGRIEYIKVYETGDFDYYCYYDDYESSPPWHVNTHRKITKNRVITASRENTKREVEIIDLENGGWIWANKRHEDDAKHYTEEEFEEDRCWHFVKFGLFLAESKNKFCWGPHAK